MEVDPALYARSNQSQKRDCSDVLKQYEKQINSHENEIVMDIGCGTGDVTVQLLLPILSSSVKQLLATDKSEAMIDYAAIHHIHPKVKYSQFELTVSEANETADLITSFHTLHWIPDQQAAFRSIYDVLKPGGHCLVLLTANNPWTGVFEKLSTDPVWGKYMADWKRYIPPYHFYSPSDAVAICKSYLEQSGFVDYTVEFTERSFDFGNEDNVKNLVGSLFPFRNRAEKNESINFLKAIVSGVTQASGMTKENNYRLKWNSLVIYAKKANQLDRK